MKDFIELRRRYNEATTYKLVINKKYLISVEENIRYTEIVYALGNGQYKTCFVDESVEEIIRKLNK